MLPVKPTPVKLDGIRPTMIKFDKNFKHAVQQFANKKEFGNVSAVVKKATAKYIRYNPNAA